MKPGSASHRIPTRPPGCWSLPEAFPPFSSTALPQVPEHPPRHPSRRDVARVPDRYSRCPSPPPPPPAGCPVGDSPAGQVGAPGGSRLWGRLQLPQGWADTGALHTAGGDTSPPHNSWQPGQRRPPSCRRRSARSGDGRRRHRHRRSCLLCRCSSCYCGEGGSSAAAGSARGAGSGGVGNQWGPMRGHLHLQPLRLSPSLRLYSGSGTQGPAARRGHDSARLRRGQQRPLQRQPPPQPRPGWAALGSRGSGLHIHNARPGLVLSPELAPGRGPGGGGRGRGALERRGSTSPLQALARSCAKFLQLGPRRAGRPAGDPGEGRLRIGAKFEALSASRRWDDDGRGTVCERLRALRAQAFHPVSPGCQGKGFATPRSF